MNVVQFLKVQIGLFFAKLSPSPSPSQAVLVLFPASPSGQPTRIVLSSQNLTLLSKEKVLGLIIRPRKHLGTLTQLVRGASYPYISPLTFKMSTFPAQNVLYLKSKVIYVDELSPEPCIGVWVVSHEAQKLLRTFRFLHIQISSTSNFFDFKFFNFKFL